MPSLPEQARHAARSSLALLDAAAEQGDLSQAAADALLGGHVLILLADPSHGCLAEQIAAATRRRFPNDLWPPLLAITADARALALIGCEDGAANPLAQQAEMLVRAGDVVVVLAGAKPSADLVVASVLAASQGAAVAGLGLPPCDLRAQLAVTLPDAPAERLIEAQLALGHALVEGLAQRLPAEAPSGVEPALLRSACTNCGAALAIPRHLAGRRGVCPSCYNNTALAPEFAPPDGEKRVHMRFSLRDCVLRVELAPPQKPPIPLPGQIALENLSFGGLLFAIAGSPVELQPNDPLHLELQTPAFLSPLALHGIVVRVTREAALHRVGVVFRDTPPAIAERLRVLERNLVLRHLTSRAAPTPRPAAKPG